MAIRKIKAALVNTRDAPDYNTEIGYLFYDADPNGDLTLRISDGVTPGGIPITGAGGGGITYARLNVVGDDSTGAVLSLGNSTPDLQITGSQNISTSVDNATGKVTITGPDLSSYLESGDNISSLTNDAGYITAADVFELTVADDSSTTTTLTKTDTLNIKGTGGITTSLSGDTITIDGSGVSGSGSGTLTISDDASTTTDITTGQDTLKFSGGTNITTSLSGDTLTIDGPTNLSQLTNDSGFINSATLKVVGDDSTGTVFDAANGDDIRFLGAGGTTVTVSGSTVIITSTGGSGGSGSVTYTQDSPPASPIDGDTWLDTDSGGLYVYVVEGGSGQWIETGSAGTTLDVDGVESIRFAADDSASVPIRTSETLSILGGQGIATSITPEGELRISSTGSSVTTSDDQPSNPNDGDLWYETDSGSLYVYVVESGNGNWIETGGGGGTSASVITQDDQPVSASDGNLWFDTDQGGLYVFVEENGVGNWIETGTSGSGPAIYTQDDLPSTASNGDLWWDTDSGSLYIYIAQNGSTAWVETSGSGQTGGGGITSLAADATPELGGNLNANSYNITNVSTISVATNGNPGTDPATDSGVGYIYAKGATAELFVKDGAGNITQISPHSEEGDWVYYSENVKTGKRVKVNMERMIRRLEEITGETFFEIDEPHKLKY